MEARNLRSALVDQGIEWFAGFGNSEKWNDTNEAAFFNQKLARHFHIVYHFGSETINGENKLPLFTSTKFFSIE